MSYLDDEEDDILPRDDQESNESGFSLPEPPKLRPQTGSPPKFDTGPTAAPPARPASSALDSSAYNAASQKVATLTGQKPAPPKPKWWQMLASGAVGGLAGFSNSQGKGKPIDPSGAEDVIMGGPGYRRQLGDWQRQLEGATAEQTSAQQQLSAAEAIQKGNAEKEMRDASLAAAQAKKAKLDQPRKTALDVYNEVGQIPGATEEDRKFAALGGKGTPHPAPVQSIEVTPEQGVKYGIKPDANGKYVLPASAADSVVRASAPPVHNPSSTDQMLNAAVMGAAVKAGMADKIDQAQPALPQLMKINPELATQVSNDYRRDPLSEQMKQLQMTATQLAMQQKRDQMGNAKPITPGTAEYRVATDLASGKLPFQQFTKLYAYSRDPNKKLAIYQAASDINENFNPAQFEMGYTFAKNPKTQAQLAALDNVNKGVADLLKFSDAAKRAGAPFLNKYLLPGGIAIGSKKYSNFQTAVDAFADELSGSLGFGSATDMKLKLGLKMTNGNIDADTFRSNLEDVIIPFVNRKRSTILGQMGPYGQQGMNPAADAQQPQQAKPATHYVGETVTLKSGQTVKIKAVDGNNFTY